MMRAMFAGVSGMQAHQDMMDVIGDNIANVNTVGFKASRAEFQTTLAQVMSGGAAGGNGVGGTNPRQIGLGVAMTATDAVMTQGAIQSTGRATDLALQGGGMFVVSTAGEQQYTRAGSFGVDESDQLVDASGALVQGWEADGTGALPAGIGTQSPPALTGVVVPHLKPGSSGPDAPSLRSFSIGETGVLTGVYSDGSSMPLAQLAVATFPNAGGLLTAGANHLRLGPSAGAPTISAPGTLGAGAVTAGALEMSNVDLAKEFTEMIIAQRGFQANSKVISSADEMLQDLVNLKR